MVECKIINWIVRHGYLNMNVVDLFSGVGGLSLGAARAGFNLAGAVEIDKHAIFSHQLNFPKSAHLHNDVSKLTAQDILSACNVQEIDCVVGGPPCQGFSSIGKGNADDTSRSKIASCSSISLVSMSTKNLFAGNAPIFSLSISHPIRMVCFC